MRLKGDPAVHGDGLRQELAGFGAVAGPVAVDEHAGVPAADLRLLYHDWQLVGLAHGDDARRRCRIVRTRSRDCRLPNL
jgi:hypothetical protein